MSQNPLVVNMQSKASEMMEKGMEMVDLFINKNYLIDLTKCEPIPLSDNEKSFSYMTLFQIEKIVYNNDENINDKLVSVYSALSNFGCTVILMVIGDETGVKMYIGTRDTHEPEIAKEVLKKSLKGNFPGIIFNTQSNTQIERILEKNLPDQFANLALTAVSIVPSPRDDDKDKFVQGIEKFIDSMSGEKYTAVFISCPLNKLELENKKRGYEEIYSALSQFSEMSLSYGENNSEALAKSVSDSFSKAINDGISDSTGSNTGSSFSNNIGKSKGHSSNLFGFGFNSGTSTGSSNGTSSGISNTKTVSNSKTDTESKSTSDSTTITRGDTSNLSITRQNKTVKQLMNRIDEQLDRIKSCESYGLWNSASYFIAEKQETAIVAANTYKALIAGEKTSVENSFINLWNNEYENANKNLMLLEYIRYGIHPKFKYLTSTTMSSHYSEQVVSPASLISGIELPIMMGIPRKSVNGITSVVSTEFGRNVLSKNEIRISKNIDLGAIYHLGEVFKQNRVKLNLNSLTAHTFITGSTGSGKSNTTYKIIDELISSKNDIRFLVIEPAKGEYKKAFGKLQDLNIFNTNPRFGNMLTINPFEFNEEIHVLEHLDRLIEIFNACWPLYAAMPAILKASFERAYLKHGWDLNHSIRLYKQNERFPSFNDLIEILPELLMESKYSDQAKGDYTGALVTRITSLTNGLVGQIFGGSIIPDEVLFDQNTIIDISRVGSSETKSLIIGLLVLKLGEHRQSTTIGSNLPLKHVTILEEAHQLLKRTNTDQSQEGANLQGKSVEMISNSIAEMRTYGEGFIIVDQSPSSVDISTIKNTNTKIIMRLPEVNDREAVGKSIGLNDQQINELSKLDRGVAVIYQNDWLEPVLTKIDAFRDNYSVLKSPEFSRQIMVDFIGKIVSELIAQSLTEEFNMSWFNTIINREKVSELSKVKIKNMLLDYQKRNKTLIVKTDFNKLIYQLVNCNDLFNIYEDLMPPLIENESKITKEIMIKACEWKEAIISNLDHYATIEDQLDRNTVFNNMVLHKISSGNNSVRYKQVFYLFKILTEWTIVK